MKTKTQTHEHPIQMTRLTLTQTRPTTHQTHRRRREVAKIRRSPRRPMKSRLIYSLSRRQTRRCPRQPRLSQSRQIQTILIHCESTQSRQTPQSRPITSRRRLPTRHRQIEDSRPHPHLTMRQTIQPSLISSLLSQIHYRPLTSISSQTSQSTMIHSITQFRQMIQTVMVLSELTLR